MRANYYSILKLVILYLILATTMSGCFGTGGEKIATKYYLIDPIHSEALNFRSDQSLAVEIIDIHLPQYLERFHIATRIGENRLNFSESNQWSENLRKNLMRTMSRNLSRLLSTQDIGTPLKRSSSTPDYRVQIYIEQFERDVDLKVKLSARWQISGNESSEPLGIYSQEMASLPTEKGDYDQMVSFMRQLYGELSSKIAESIIAEKNK
ncbi:MAG: membrane integrity-associated transporter subunit PqiC [Gammaproteobacteria bacterium]|nr:membrane integrity-associated transporter subunit PqiC [Gammaproteobacteria bacterium]MCK5499038.1 membrane integrity-associated transporter subunit PqiC [Gammaproteobacteria bacterium]